MNRTSEQLGSRVLVAGAALLLAIFAVLGADIAADRERGLGIAHVSTEAAAMVLAALGAAALLTLVVRGRREGRRLRAELAQSQAEADRWRAETRDVLAGLSAAIDRQFDRWQLSDAERQVGLLLLKGLSHKEIADVRSVSERTARQQARSLYRKAGLAGRAELAAFFLEDLLLPHRA